MSHLLTVISIQQSDIGESYTATNRIIIGIAINEKCTQRGVFTNHGDHLSRRAAGDSGGSGVHSPCPGAVGGLGLRPEASPCPGAKGGLGLVTSPSPCPGADIGLGLGLRPEASPGPGA